MAARYYRPHLAVYGIATLLAAAVAAGLEQWWLAWPWSVWSFIFAAHFFLVRSLAVNEDWVRERTAYTVDKAYDFDHIQSIQDRQDAIRAAAEKTAKAPQEGSEEAGETDNEPGGKS